MDSSAAPQACMISNNTKNSNCQLTLTVLLQGEKQIHGEKHKTQACPGWGLSAEKQQGKDEIQSSKNP